MGLSIIQNLSNVVPSESYWRELGIICWLSIIELRRISKFSIKFHRAWRLLRELKLFLRHWHIIYIFNAIGGLSIVTLRHRLFDASSSIHIKVHWADHRTIVVTILNTSASTFGCMRHHAWIDRGGVLLVFHFCNSFENLRLLIILFWF